MKKKRILLVEENTALSFLIETLLEKNYHTIQVSDSFHAVKELVAGAHFDLLIICIDEVASDKFELLHHVSTSSLLRTIPVLVLSNSEDRELQEKCSAGNVALFLHKPFDPQFFVEKINEITLLKTTHQVTRKKINLFNLNFYF